MKYAKKEEQINLMMTKLLNSPYGTKKIENEIWEIKRIKLPSLQDQHTFIKQTKKDEQNQNKAVFDFLRDHCPSLLIDTMIDEEAQELVFYLFSVEAYKQKAQELIGIM